jgi:hypothetical protein
LAAILAPSIGAALAAVVALSGAQAQNEAPTAVERAAAAALQAIPASDDPEWATRWDATGSRMSGGPVRWHLAEPDASADAARRTGWAGARGEQFAVAVCGDSDAVGAIAFRFSGDRGEALAAAFAAQGVELERLESDRAPEPEIEELRDDAQDEWAPERAYARYALTGASHRPATLETRLSCSSPRARGAQSCRTDARVVYAPEVEGASDCVNPGRF